MAANNPNSTYTTKRFPIVGNPELRDPLNDPKKDQLFINFIASEHKGIDGPELFLEQRPGLKFSGASPNPTGTSTGYGEGRGIYSWQYQVTSVIGNKLYIIGNTLGATLSTSTGPVGFYEYRDASNQRCLIVLDGVDGYIIATTGPINYTVTKITSPNFPTPHRVQGAMLDGYLFVAKTGTADVYNCNLNDPLTWTAGDFITAESYPDVVSALCRQNNYVVALGSRSMEYFYDAGTAPGTPLARNSAALHQIGLAAPYTLAQIEDQFIFMGQSAGGGRSVWLMDGTVPVDIGTETVRASLDAITDLVYPKAFCVRAKGRKFYVLNIVNITWVYDLESQMWTQWAGSQGEAAFPCDCVSDNGSGSVYLLDRLRGLVYTFDSRSSQDSLDMSQKIPIVCVAITKKYDFGTLNRKFMSRLAVVADNPSADNATSCTLYWTDDDYKTYSSGRVIPFSATMTSTTQLGSFRRRAFKLVYSSVYPIRIEGFEVDINSGSQ